MYWTTAGSATAWHNLNPPTTDETLAMGSNTTQWTWTETAADMFTFISTGAFGDYSVVRIEQSGAGDPTDGELLSLSVKDAEAHVDQLAIFNGTDESELTRLVDGGSITRTLASTDGFAQWIYSTVEDGTGATDTDGIFEIQTNATMDADQDIFNVVKGTTTLFSVDEDGDIATTGTVDVTDTTEASAIGTAAVTIDGGASIAKDLWLGDDFVLDSDDVVISLGDGQDVTITHDPDDGIFLKSTATTDDNPIILTMQTGETDINLDDALGGIYFQAPDEGTGTDAILVAAGIEAVSVGEFGAASNATKLSFLTANSEVAAEKASLDQAGNFTSSGDINVTGGDVKLGADPADAGVGLRLSNGNVIAWEDAAEVTITHVDDSGLLLNSTHYLSFGDAGTYINQGTDGDLDLVADTNVEITVSDEDLTFADGGTNLVTIGTNTGVTEINTTLQFVTTGDIMGGINIHTDTANYVVETDDTSESYGTLFINGDNDAQTWTLPTAVAGKSMCFMQGQGVTAAITVTPGASDYLVVDSVRGTAATAYTSSGDGGDKICVVAVSADDWIVTSIQGTWSE
jgi:hypothetical protein